MMPAFLALLSLLLFATLHANDALANTKTYTFRKYFQDSGSYFIDGPFIAPIRGALSWDIFAAIEEKDNHIHWGELSSRNRQEVILYGYIFTLNTKQQLSHFLVGPYQPTCPFHYHVRKNLVVSVLLDKTMPYTSTPVLLKGILHLLPDANQETLVLLEHAELLN